MSLYAERSTQEEIMDDLTRGGEVMDQTLREIENINRLLGGNSVTLQAIDKLIDRSMDKVWRIVDVGCGGGDMLVRIHRWAQKNGIRTELIGIDANPHVVAFAREHCRAYPDIRFETMNILSPEFENLTCDILTATLFLHHFTDKQIVKMLPQWTRQATTGIAINDLHRHWLAHRSINVLTGLFSRSEMVKFDAGVSVLRGFRSNELKSLLRFARIKDYRLRWMWAFRWQLIIRTDTP